MSTLLLALPASVAAIYAGLRVTLHALHGPLEPPAVATTIPFLEPVLHLAVLGKRSRYFVELNEKHSLPMVTLHLPGSRMYIINSPTLIHAAQRQSVDLKFGPIALEFGFLFSGLSQASQHKIKVAYAKHGNGLTMMIKNYLKPTSDLLAHMSSVATSDMAVSLSRGFEHPTQAGLYDTIGHQVMLSLTNALYGPYNPFRNETIEQSWNQFLPGIEKLLSGALPSITARSELKARARVAQGFEDYFTRGHQIYASPIVQSNFENAVSYGLPLSEIGKFEIALSLAVLSSRGITAFWLIFHIFSDPDLHAAIHKEILENLVTQSCTYSGDHLVSVKKADKKCPILFSTLQEVYRFYSTALSVKQVTQSGTMLGPYKLEKDAVLMIPGPVVHKDFAIWGQDAKTFNHRRFLQPAKSVNDTDAVEPIKTKSSTFRPFGAGESMCPGRFFSTNVILAITVIMVLELDITPDNAQATWNAPTTNNAGIWKAIPDPDSDVPVIITKKKDTNYIIEWNN